VSDATASLISHSAGSTIGSLFRARVVLHPDAIALDDGARTVTYADLNERVNRLANGLTGLGVGRGDRVAVLSENRIEYLEAVLASAKIGSILACQNWRLAPPELQHCIQLVEPRVGVASPRHAGLLTQVDCAGARMIRLGDEYEALLADAEGSEPADPTEPEDGLLILYTSGTTGLPKGAVLSHRAEIARNMLLCSDLGVAPGDTYAAWAPMYHMAATEPSIGALLSGGKVVVIDGFDPPRIAEVVEREPLGWLLLMPGMIEPLIAELAQRKTVPRGVKVCGAMADLVPAHQIADITRLVDAPYVNTFGATETGAAPCSRGLIPPGVVPESLSKIQNTFCEIRLVDADDNDVAVGQPGECAIRGPTLFSGYWRAEETNANDFRGGWFHMGDMFRRNADGTLDFVDRVKYMIKSGGENIYPAEIERVLLSHSQVADAVVVRRTDAKWGEVPVAFVARKGESLAVEELAGLCREQLAGYKQPKEIRFVALEALPRSTTGKIQRHEVEGWLE
jgi:fatty-acyl-CoA synthase